MVDYIKLLDDIKHDEYFSDYTNKFIEAASSFYKERAKLTNMQFSRNPLVPQQTNNVEGHFSELLVKTLELNKILSSNNPPLANLPINREELSELVGNYMSYMFSDRK